MTSSSSSAGTEKRNWKRTLGSAAVATAVAEVITLPACTTKTWMQVHDFKQPSKAFKDLWAKGGLRALFSAKWIAIGGQVWSTSSKWAAYQELQQRTNNNDNRLWLSMANSLVSGHLVSLTTHPIDVIRTHRQLQTKMADILRTQWLYKGYTKTLSKTTVGSLLFFPLNDWVKKHLVVVLPQTSWQRRAQPWIAGAISATLATLVMHPLDYIKTRDMSHKPWRHGWSVLPYYRGLSLNLLRIVPHFTIVMGITDVLSHMHR